MPSYRYDALLCVLALATVATVACSSGDTVTSPSPAADGPSAPPPAPGPAPMTRINSDSALFTFITQGEPFSAYAPFPNLDTASDRTLAASSAHQPIIRVSMNATAAAVLRNGSLPAGARFPDGSVIFKEVLTSGRSVDLYAVMYKDRSNSTAANGWLWAEYRPNGGVNYSISNRGGGCTGCHSLSEGPQHDSVRIFERQR